MTSGVVAATRSGRLMVTATAMLLWTTATADLFTSVNDMQKALYAEHAVAHDLRAYIRRERERIDQLERFVKSA